MRRIRTTAAGLLVSTALLAGAASAVLATAGTAAPAGARAATMVEYATL
jgi:hypothetical protein